MAGGSLGGGLSLPKNREMGNEILSGRFGKNPKLFA
jgi:hypothetical protein